MPEFDDDQGDEVDDEVDQLDELPALKAVETRYKLAWERGRAVRVTEGLAQAWARTDAASRPAPCDRPCCRGD